MTHSIDWSLDVLPNGLRVVTFPARHLHAAMAVAYVRSVS